MYYGHRDMGEYSSSLSTVAYSRDEKTFSAAIPSARIVKDTHQPLLSLYDRETYSKEGQFANDVNERLGEPNEPPSLLSATLQLERLVREE